LVAELPHRVANDLLRRVIGLELSSCGAQGIIDSTAADHTRWRTDTEAQADVTVAALVGYVETNRTRIRHQEPDTVVCLMEIE
jgi:hypothetical protein